MYNEFSDRAIEQVPLLPVPRVDDPNLVYATAAYATTFASHQPQPLAPIPRWRFREVVILTLSGVFIASVVGIPTYLMVLIISDPSPNGEMAAVSCAAMIAFLAIFGGLLMVGRALGKTWGELGFRRPTGGWLLGGVFLSIMLLPIRILVVLLILGIPNDEATGSETFVELDSWFWLAFVVFLLTAIALAPLTEELVFRSVLYGWMRRTGSIIGAAVISGILFGLAHFDIRMALANSIMGVALALAYEHSRSLWVPIMMHFINNLIAGGLLLLLTLVAVSAGGI